MAVSGISLPPNRVLNLHEAKVCSNSKVLTPHADEIETTDAVSSNAVIPDNANRRLRRVARFVVVKAAAAQGQAVSLPSVATHIQRALLPLQLATLGSINVDALWFRAGSESDGISAGLDQPALEFTGEQHFVALSEDGCAAIETSLPWLLYSDSIAAPLDRFLAASMEPNRIEASLRFLVAMETLVDPGGGHQRNRSARVSRRIAAAASANVDEARAFRKLVDQAYKYRPAVWHGEGDAALVDEAGTWLSSHYRDLRVVTSLGFQRAIGNTRHRQRIPWAELMADVDAGGPTAIGYLARLPRLYVREHQVVHLLDFRDFTAVGGGSFQIITDDS